MLKYGSLILLGALLSLASCRRTPPATPIPDASQPPVPAPSSGIRTSDGLVIEPIQNPPSDRLAKILDAKLWEFDVTMPRPSTPLWCWTDFRRSKGASSVSGIHIGRVPSRRLHVRIGLIPLGKSWSDADKMKYFLQVESTNAANADGETMSSVEPNVFRSSQTSVSSSDVSNDGRIFLYGVATDPRKGSYSLSPENFDAALFVRLTTHDRYRP